MLLVHATTVVIGQGAVVIRGPSGSGKSDLALRLIDRGAVLVSDDQTELRREGDALVASPPSAIAGLIEARGVGLLRLPHLVAAPVRLAVDLVAPAEVERLPEPAFAEFLGVRVPLLRLAAFDASTLAKVRLAALCPTRDIIRPS